MGRCLLAGWLQDKGDDAAKQPARAAHGGPGSKPLPALWPTCQDAGASYPTKRSWQPPAYESRRRCAQTLGQDGEGCPGKDGAVGLGDMTEARLQCPGPLSLACRGGQHFLKLTSAGCGLSLSPWPRAPSPDSGPATQPHQSALTSWPARGGTQSAAPAGTLVSCPHRFGSRPSWVDPCREQPCVCVSTAHLGDALPCSAFPRSCATGSSWFSPLPPALQTVVAEGTVTCPSMNIFL